MWTQLDSASRTLWRRCRTVHETKGISHTDPAVSPCGPKATGVISYSSRWACSLTVLLTIVGRAIEGATTANCCGWVLHEADLWIRVGAREAVAETDPDAVVDQKLKSDHQPIKFDVSNTWENGGRARTPQFSLRLASCNTRCGTGMSSSPSYG